MPGTLDTPGRPEATEMGARGGRTLHVLNLGAGVQSTALYLMSMRQDEPEHVPVFDCAIFADTQEEPRAVYEHLAWLKSLGGPPIIEATAGKLGDHLIASTNLYGQPVDSTIPTYYRNDEGKVSLGHRQCTKDYKLRVIEQTIRRQVLGMLPRQRVRKGVKIVQYLGLSFDEPRRVISAKLRFQAITWAEPRFSLFDLEMSRRGCVVLLAKAAPGRKIPRSACVFCSFKTNDEWRDLRDNDPGGWARACQVSDALAARGEFVHRSCVPLASAPIDTPESRGEQYTFGFAQECEGMCGV